jgi:hypothetical protein
LEDQGVEERIILKWIFKECVGRGMDWLDVAHDRERGEDVVNAVMDLRFHKM